VEKFPQWSSGAVLATLQSACSDCSGEAVGERKDGRESPGEMTMERPFSLTLKRTIKRVLYPSLLRLGVYDRLIEKYHRDKVVILWGHRVSRDDNGHEEGAAPLSFEEGITQAYFERLMRFLREKMHPVSLEEIVSFVAGEKRIPDRAVSLTMDDGYMDNYLNAFPILKQYQIPATIFLTTGYTNTDSIYWWDLIGEILKRTKIKKLEMREIKILLDGKGGWLPDIVPLNTLYRRNAAWDDLTFALRWCGAAQISKVIELMEDRLEVNTGAYKHLHSLLTWSQIREMSRNGIDFGAHTDSHQPLSTLSSEQLLKEFLVSKQAIEEQIGKPVASFAYPYGDCHAPGLDLPEMLAQCGFQCAFTVENGHVDAGSNPFALKRVGIENSSVGIMVNELVETVKNGTN